MGLAFGDRVLLHPIGEERSPSGLLDALGLAASVALDVR